MKTFKPNSKMKTGFDNYLELRMKDYSFAEQFSESLGHIRLAQVPVFLASLPPNESIKKFSSLSYGI
jgi:hypothetical protein